MRCALFVFSTLCSIAAAQQQFTVPDPGQTDLSESWSVGQTINISWVEGWNGVGDAPDKADLWISWFRSDSFSQLVLENVTFDKSGSLDWKINVSNSVIQTDPQFVFRFKPHSDPPIYVSNDNESPSRGFVLLPGNEPSTSTTFSTTSTASSTSTPTTATIESTSKSSTNLGAILGGVLGGLAFIIVVCIFALLVLRRRKRKVIEEVEENRSGGPERLQLKEYYAQETVSAELDGIEVPVEAGDERANRHELETSSR